MRRRLRRYRMQSASGVRVPSEPYSFDMKVFCMYFLFSPLFSCSCEISEVQLARGSRTSRLRILIVRSMARYRGFLHPCGSLRVVRVLYPNFFMEHYLCFETTCYPVPA